MWRLYQREAAEFFRSLGLTATVDASIEGVRSTHDVDVLVEFAAFGLEHRWIVECKAWNRRVPKERIEVLKSIVSETGADRGFLICEKGAQSGAITAARLSNVTITSLDDLQANAEADMKDLRWSDLVKRWFDWNGRWHAVATSTGTQTWLTLVEHVNSMGAVEEGLRRFRTGRFPAPYGALSNHDAKTAAEAIRYLSAQSADDFLDGAAATIEAAERFLRQHGA